MPGWRAAAILLLSLGPAQAETYEGSPFYGYAFEPGGGYPLSLPQTLRATVAVPVSRMATKPADTLDELYPALAACWQVPAGLGPPKAEPEDIEITARFALRRDGSLIGAPRITYAAGVAGDQRAILVRGTVDALARCTPVHLTRGLGRAIAGRPVALRFVYRPPA
ncbi:hypothetical protein MMSR116_23450 [Methylobacterium mesophilicum SR1.6/6]|uniref:TonB C-terminal domain-containing protein n=1 Tax=Methylobacterium mesophilicum SR1.6/6 TaxID=908290 RepID=A0A6B9FTW6_9HYPH|nr:hypothetical protein [Methylobacterium mesophilicum]QGY04538.1 hypothetical protein MMSR116_23450 [Methylobacterium mesophilicum SR1.6/6]